MRKLLVIISLYVISKFIAHLYFGVRWIFELVVIIYQSRNVSDNSYELVCIEIMASLAKSLIQSFVAVSSSKSMFTRLSGCPRLLIIL